ncbi:MAG: hypothetical protein OXH16_03110 [Gemmatimonadetes bacterium]|nr:hypothetical protein [Gemmatimonadota bacterium]
MSEKSLVSVLVFLMLLGCSVFVVDKTVREKLDIAWGNDQIRGSIRWKFTGGDNPVRGAWTIYLYNPTPEDCTFRVARLSFVDAEGFQVAEYRPRWDSLFVGGFQSSTLQGNFEIKVDALTANTIIADMEVYAVVE